MTDRRLLGPLRVFSLVAAGGFVGANARHGVAVALADLPTGLAGTLAANVLGCILLGFLLSLSTEAVSRRARLLVGTGFLSSFTTYSTFAVETATSPPALALANVGANYALGFAGVVIGRLLAREVAE